MLLSLRDLSIDYGQMRAVSSVDLDVEEGSIVGLLGANGSGKSTLLKAVSGLQPPTEGTVEFGDERIDGLPTASIIRRGVAHILEGRRLFPYMTVEQNLEMGAFARIKGKRALREQMAEVFADFPVLERKSSHVARNLSGGEQQMVAIARAVMTRPRLLLMDEPCQGLAPVIVEELEETVRRLNDRGISIVLVEHNVRFSLNLCDRIYILEGGRVAFQGGPEDFSEDEYVQKIYLGG